MIIHLSPSWHKDEILTVEYETNVTVCIVLYKLGGVTGRLLKLASATAGERKAGSTTNVISARIE